MNINSDLKSPNYIREAEKNNINFDDSIYSPSVNQYRSPLLAKSNFNKPVKPIEIIVPTLILSKTNSKLYARRIKLIN
jgi:hypothetical protein